MARPQDQEIQSVYPTTLDTFTHLPELDDRHNKVHRELQRGLEQVQSTMGLSPQGAYSTMRSRLDDVQGTESHFLDSTDDPSSPFVVNPLHSDFGAVGDGVTDDTAALQGAIDYARSIRKPVWLPAVFAVTAPIKFYGEMEFYAPNGGAISAVTGFDFSANADTAVVEVYSNDPTPVRFGGPSRLTIDGRLNINCGNFDGSRGMIASLQQQTEIRGLRINGARDVGLWLRGQQAQFYDLMIVAPSDTDGAQIGVKLDLGAKFFTFVGLNLEKMNLGFIADSSGPNWVRSFHVEQNQGADGAKAFEIISNGLWLSNGWWSPGAAPRTFLKATSAAYYLENIRLNTNDETIVAIEDADLPGGQLLVANAFRQHVNTFWKLHGASQAAQAHPYTWTLYSPLGQHVTLGGIKTSDSQMRVNAGATQTGDMAEFVDAGGTTRFRVDDTAHPVLPTYTNAARPAANTVPAGTAIFNSDDNFSNISDGTNWRDPTGATT